MRVIMFQPRFEEPILQGIKGSTIRGKARCKEGDELSLRVWIGKPYRQTTGAFPHDLPGHRTRSHHRANRPAR